ncbi:MAG: hypothetical protein U9R56_00685, partial [candidate division Zixibacteria bacterium]|nr:hypothetical protein [candidate division Zixibacteria bacterium]
RAHSKDTQYLPNSFGLLVNDYVGMLLQTRYERNHQLRCGDDFDIGMYTGKRCDWIIVEDDSVVLMEVKSTRFSRQVIESWSINEFREFVRERYLKAAEQLLAFKDTLRSEFGQSQFYLIILVIEQFPFFNLLPKFFDDSDPALNLIRDNRVQFVNISELEVFLANRRFRLSSILEDKIENEDTSIKPFSPFVSRLDGYKWNKSLPLLERTLSDIFKWKELHATSSCNQ